MDKSSSRRHLTLRLFLTELEGVKAAVPGAAASAGCQAAGSEVGLAKTMLFSPEIRPMSHAWLLKPRRPKRLP